MNIIKSYTYLKILYKTIISMLNNLVTEVFTFTGMSDPLKYYNFICFIIVKLKSVTLREEHRLKMFENQVLMNIFGPNRD